MSGGAGFSLLWRTREAVGIYPAHEGLALVRLGSADGDGRAWMVTESQMTETPCPTPLDAAVLASAVCAALQNAGWEKLPLALALPAFEAETEERTLPVLLTGGELREALLWDLRAEVDEMGKELSDDVRLLCMPLRETMPQRYWTARMEGARIGAYFSAFSAEGLALRLITVCPPEDNPLAAEIEAARDPRMPWEDESAGDVYKPAVYAGLLVRAGKMENLYWAAERIRVERLRPYAAVLIAAFAAAVFLANVAADLASCAAARQARDHAVEELALRASERRQMEEITALRVDVAERERILTAFMEGASPVRALLVHLGTITADGVRLTSVRAEHHGLRIEGEAVNYAALAAFMSEMEEDPFFSAMLTVEQAGEERAAPEAPAHIRFTLRSDWL